VDHGGVTTGYLNIGAFALLSGCSITALRHYDEIGLLPPAAVDERTAFRRYAPEQVARARTIRALRAVDMPLDEIRHILDVANEAERRRLLAAHRERLASRAEDIAAMIEHIDGYVEGGIGMAGKVRCRVAEVNIGVTDVDAARTFYESVFDVEFGEHDHGDGFRHLFAAFGSWPSDEFFLLNVHDARCDEYRANRANFGLLVDDLDEVHRRALAHGGTELQAPHDAEGMPRCSAVCDPSGNLVNLYQNV
jgi:DNA-binding transcriptional MerR regulator